MTRRTYKTSRWLWCVASLAIFTAIGFTVRIPIKSEPVPLARRTLEIVSDLLSGQEELSALFAVAVLLLVWSAIALIVGWFLQSLIVIAIFRRHEKSKPSA